MRSLQLPSAQPRFAARPPQNRSRAHFTLFILSPAIQLRSHGVISGQDFTMVNHRSETEDVGHLQG
jgi:hypothetical protein